MSEHEADAEQIDRRNDRARERSRRARETRVDFGSDGCEARRTRHRSGERDLRAAVDSEGEGLPHPEEPDPWVHEPGPDLDRLGVRAHVRCGERRRRRELLIAAAKTEEE